jgi:hypothetical protein
MKDRKYLEPMARFRAFQCTNVCMSTCIHVCLSFCVSVCVHVRIYVKVKCECDYVCVPVVPVLHVSQGKISKIRNGNGLPI